jgi:hypothetical protein
MTLGWRNDAPICPEPIPFLPTILERNAERGQGSPSQGSERQKNPK